MKALKWIGIGVGSLAALVGGILVLVFWLTSGAVDAAEAFLSLVGKGQYEEAYRAAAPQFRTSQDLASFRATMQRYGLDQYESASWSSREINDGRATLEGTVRTRGGGRVPTSVVLVKSDGAWLVYGMRFTGAGVGTREEAPGGAALDQAAMKRLALRSLLDFNEAVRRADFTSFHAGLARPMREKYTPQQLLSVFQAFVDQKIDLTPIGAVEPIFESGEARAGRGGELALKGRFPTRPSEVQFELTYVMDGGEWRLISIDVRVRSPQ
ncbi:MAG TPA: hypothetical protein VIF14_06435 [Alphaproteobacteria bacterium]